MIGTPAIGDFDSDGRLDIAYSMVWLSTTLNSEDTTTDLKVFAFTLVERFKKMVVGPGGGSKGLKVMDFESFLPADQQPWNRYMGCHGNNVYHRGG